MSTIKRGLGKGLGALIHAVPEEETDEVLPFTAGRSIVNVDVEKIIPNVRQPRKFFKDSAINELSLSIKEQGLAQPILVRHKGGKYEIVAGERRWRAAKLAGLATIPAIVKDYSDVQSLELALVENLQREDLNPIESAQAFKLLNEDFNLTHEEIAKKVGKDRATISNILRLLDLPKEIQDSIFREEITAGHARPLLSIEGRDKQIETWKQILKGNLNVRAVEGRIRSTKHKAQKRQNKDPYLAEFSEKLTEEFGTKVEIHGNAKKGKILINYYSQEDLERIMEEIAD